MRKYKIIRIIFEVYSYFHHTFIYFYLQVEENQSINELFFPDFKPSNSLYRRVRWLFFVNAFLPNGRTPLRGALRFAPSKIHLKKTSLIGGGFPGPASNHQQTFPAIQLTAPETEKKHQQSITIWIQWFTHISFLFH